MKLSTNALLPMGLTLLLFLVGACSPFYPKPHPNDPGVPNNTGQTTLTPAEQQQLNASRGLDAQGNPLNPTGINSGALTPSGTNTAGAPPTNMPPPNTTGKKNYPTAAAVPGRPGFVYNPYTHTMVNVTGIRSGQLCADPEDPDAANHKFRVP